MALLPMLTPILAHLEAARLTQLLEAQPGPGEIAAGIAIAFITTILITTMITTTITQKTGDRCWPLAYRAA